MRRKRPSSETVTSPAWASSEAILLADCRVIPTRPPTSCRDTPGTSKDSRRMEARPGPVSSTNRGASAESIKPSGNIRFASSSRYPFSRRFRSCHRTVAWDKERALHVSPTREHGRRQRYWKTWRRRAFARLGPSISRSSPGPSWVRTSWSARPIPRYPSGILVLLQDKFDDLLRLETAEVFVRQSVQRLVEAIQDRLGKRASEDHLSELGGDLGGRWLPSVDPVHHQAESSDDLVGVRRLAVAAAPALHDFEGAARRPVRRVDPEVDHAVGQVHRNDGLRTRQVRRAVLLEGAQDRADLPGLLQHEGEEVPLFVQVLRGPEDGGQGIDGDPRVASLPLGHERGEFLPDEVRELPPGRVDKHEQLVLEVVEDVGPAHLDGLADDLFLVLVEG